MTFGSCPTISCHQDGLDHTGISDFLPVYLFIAHGGIRETFRCSVYGQQKYIHTEPAQQHRSSSRAQGASTIDVQQKKRVGIPKRENGKTENGDDFKE